MAGEDEGRGKAKGGLLNPKGRFPRKAASSLRLSGLAGGAFQAEETICKGRVGKAHDTLEKEAATAVRVQGVEGSVTVSRASHKDSKGHHTGHLSCGPMGRGEGRKLGH